MNKISNGQKMVKKHDHKRNKKTRDFSINDLVTIKIPRIDRSSTQFRRMPGKVIDKKFHNIEDTKFQIKTEYGILKDWYSIGDLEPYSSHLEILEGVINMVSLTEAAKIQGARVGSLELVIAMCNCTGKCGGDKRCSCFARGFK